MPESNPFEMLIITMKNPAVTPVHPRPKTIKPLATLLLGDTDSPATTTGSLGVLTTDTETPVVSETAVGTDLLEALKILTELGVDTVGQDVRVLAVNNVALSVEEPGGDLVLCGVLDDRHNTLELFGGKLTSTAVEYSLVFSKNSSNSTFSSSFFSPEKLVLMGVFSYRLFRSTSAFLQTKLEYRRPTPLILVKAYITFCLPSTLVFRRRKI